MQRDGRVASTCHTATQSECMHPLLYLSCPISPQHISHSAPMFEHGSLMVIVMNVDSADQKQQKHGSGREAGLV